MQRQLGQPIVVEPRPGASGAIAASTVIKAPADGYTIFFGPVTQLHPIFLANNPVDAAKDFAPISDSLTAPWVLFASGKLPVNSMQELLAHAKTLPSGALNMARTIPNQDLLMEFVKSATGLTYTSVPFSSQNQFLPMLINGEMAFNISLFGNFQSYFSAGTIKPLFVFAAKRSTLHPSVPTAAEVGIPGVEAALVIGFWATRGTPRAIIDKISGASIAALSAQEVAELFKKLGYEPLGSSPDEQLRAYEQSMKLWTQAARLGNLKPQ